MPSFDIVSEVDLQEARNGVENAVREVESRFDFRGVEATIELNDAMYRKILFTAAKPGLWKRS